MVQDLRVFEMYYERFDPASPPSRENSACYPYALFQLKKVGW